MWNFQAWPNDWQALPQLQLSALGPLTALDSILVDIQRAIDAKLYYPALLVALTIPDICAALTLDKSVNVTARDYIRFVERYTVAEPGADPEAVNFIGVDGVMCYRLRCGVVHRGNSSA